MGDRDAGVTNLTPRAHEIADIGRGEPIASRACMSRLVLTLVTCVAASGCATIMNDGHANHVPVATNPAGAAVFVDGAFAGYTPTVVSLDRAHSTGSIAIAAPGYVPVMIVRERGIDDWFWGNLLTFGWIGVIVDAMSDSIYGFDETPIHVDLMPLGPPCGCQTDGPP